MLRTNSTFVWLCGVLGAGMVLTSCVTRQWQYLDGLSLNEGLWQYCTAFDCYENSSEEKLNATKALLVIGIVLIGIGFLTDTTGTCVSRNVVVHMIVMQVLAIGCVIGAYGLYASELKKSAYKWGWSFIVGCVGAGIYSIGFIFLASMLF